MPVLLFWQGGGPTPHVVAVFQMESARYVPHLDTWPECFVQCGIVTEDFREPPGVDRTVMAGQVQWMMALISMERCDIDKGTKLVSRRCTRSRSTLSAGGRTELRTIH